MGDATITVERFADWLRDFSTAIADNAGNLTELDSAIGDADHGINMQRGMKAVVAVLESTEFETPDALFKKVGMTLVSTVGGASGPLYGTFFLRLGAAMQGESEVTPQTLGSALRAGVEGIVSRGKAELEDKTMYDAWAPAVDAYDEATAGGQSLRDALAAASSAADRGRDATVPLVARKGRASYLGERSAGHLDPGATSTALMLASAAHTLAS